MLQNRGHLTAMTGDGERFRELAMSFLVNARNLGVNDAPSLKRVRAFPFSVLSRWPNFPAGRLWYRRRRRL